MFSCMYHGGDKGRIINNTKCAENNYVKTIHAKIVSPSTHPYFRPKFKGTLFGFAAWPPDPLDCCDDCDDITLERRPV